jgi:AraC family transcriptional regulator of adaptative response/methylated-DNA-[protein]-cysteine methyltransferase
MAIEAGHDIAPEAMIDSIPSGSAESAADIDADWAYGAFERRDRSLDGRFVARC